MSEAGAAAEAEDEGTKRLSKDDALQESEPLPEPEFCPTLFRFEPSAALLMLLLLLLLAPNERADHVFNLSLAL